MARLPPLLRGRRAVLDHHDGGGPLLATPRSALRLRLAVVADGHGRLREALRGLDGVDVHRGIRRTLLREHSRHIDPAPPADEIVSGLPAEPIADQVVSGTPGNLHAPLGVRDRPRSVLPAEGTLIRPDAYLVGRQVALEQDSDVAAVAAARKQGYHHRDATFTFQCLT